MHKEILTKEQVALLPVIGQFSKNFGLVGGTAVALQIGHRRSIDFDLFSSKPFDNLNIKRRLIKKIKIDKIFVNKKGEFTFITQGVKITFFHYPFGIDYSQTLHHHIKMADLLTLAAMKAYALGQRAKWKDYIDLYFIMNKYHGIIPIVKRAQAIFNQEFNEKLFRSQLTYLKDVSYAEEVIYMPGFEVEDKVIEKKLIEFSLQ